MRINELNEQVKIRDMLARYNFYPQDDRGNDLYYFSPIREKERTPSFHVNVKENLWFDFGLARGGNLFDLALWLWPRSKISEVLARLNQDFATGAFNVEYKKDNRAVIGKDGQKKGKTPAIFLDAFPLKSAPLIAYVRSRGIDIDLARQYMSEVVYKLGEKKYYAVGFPSDEGGWELRNKYFKGCIIPKGGRHIKTGCKTLSLFEGGFDFLSHLTVAPHLRMPATDYLIMNSTTQFKHYTDLMREYPSIHGYFDLDINGKATNAKALELLGNAFTDKSGIYVGKKDYNNWLMEVWPAIRVQQTRIDTSQLQQALERLRLHEGQQDKQQGLFQ